MSDQFWGLIDTCMNYIMRLNPDTELYDKLPTLEEMIVLDEARINKLREAGATDEEISFARIGREQHVGMFFMQNGDLMEEEDKLLFRKNSKLVAGFLAKWVLGSGFLNMVLGTLTDDRFYYLSRPFRFTIRTAIFLAPGAYFFNVIAPRFQRGKLYIEQKYADRVATFMRTRDPRAINPNLKPPRQMPFHR